jgi:hypothetical protein
MLRVVRKNAWRGWSALAAVLLVAPSGFAQERGEEVVGTISTVRNLNLTVTREGKPEVHVRVTPNAEVYFADSGDRKLFPNPSVGDLRAGMGVRFVYGTGVLDKITVHYVPAGGPARPEPLPAPPSGQVKARLQSIGGDGRSLRADVAGRTQFYRVEAADVRSFRAGDLVLLTVENRGSERVVTRIESADLVGTVRRFDSRRRSVTIEVNGRDETYATRDGGLLEGIREGDRVRFEVEERAGGSRVVTAIRRLR